MEDKPTINDLQTQLDLLQTRVDALLDYSRIPLELENGLLARGFTKVILNGTTGSVYVAPTSGASPTTQITFTNGLRTL